MGSRSAYWLGYSSQSRSNQPGNKDWASESAPGVAVYVSAKPWGDRHRDEWKRLKLWADIRPDLPSPAVKPEHLAMLPEFQNPYKASALHLLWRLSITLSPPAGSYDLPKGLTSRWSKILRSPNSSSQSRILFRIFSPSLGGVLTPCLANTCNSLLSGGRTVVIASSFLCYLRSCKQWRSL